MTPPPGATRGYLSVASAAALWATWPFVLRLATRFGPMPAPLQAAIAMGVLGLCAAPGAFVARRRRGPGGAPLPVTTIVAFGLAGGGNIALFFAAYAHTRVAVAVAAPLFGEPTSRRSRGAAALSVLGLALLLAPWEADQGPVLLGAALGTGSAVLYAAAVLLQKRLAGRYGESELLAYHAAVAFPLLLACVPLDAMNRTSAASVAVVALGGVGPGFFAGGLFLYGLRSIPSSHASILTLLEPFLATTAAAFVYGERLGPTAVVGAAAILLGAALVIRESAPPAGAGPPLGQRTARDPSAPGGPAPPPP